MVNAQKWKKWTIGEMISRTKTTIQTGPFGTVLSASEFVDYGIPIISVREIREGFILITAETPCITDDTYSRLRKYALSEKDIVFARKGSVERSALIPIGLERYFLGSDGIRIRFDQNIVSPDLMLYLFQSPSTKQFLIQSSYGTTMAGLNEKILCALEFYLPETIDEQERIAKVLADIDHLLALTEKLIIKKKAIKQGAMQELLTGKRRLPGFSEKWEEKPISFFGIFVSGNCFPIKYQGCPSGELPFYKVSDFNNAGNSRVMDKANNYISHNVASVLSCKIIPKNSVVFAKIGAAISLERKRITVCDCCIDNNMMSFLPYQKNIATYMCYLLQTIRFGEFVEATALPSLSGKTIGEIQRAFPPTIEEQIAIATVLSDLDSEIEALEQKLAKYRQVKQGMMQQLLTGKIRLV